MTARRARPARLSTATVDPRRLHYARPACPPRRETHNKPHTKLAASHKYPPTPQADNSTFAQALDHLPLHSPSPHPYTPNPNSGTGLVLSLTSPLNSAMSIRRLNLTNTCLGSCSTVSRHPAHTSKLLEQLQHRIQLPAIGSRQMSQITFWCRTSASAAPPRLWGCSSELPPEGPPSRPSSWGRGEAGSYRTGRSWPSGGRGL